MRHDSIHKKVIIIGGGISGIKTALDLYNNGVKDTLILEARDRLGGRLLSIDSPDDNVKYDLGASWFHDSLANPLFERAIQKGNVSYYMDDGNHVYFSKDEVVPSWKFDSSLEEFISFTSFVYEKDPEKADISLKELFLEYTIARKNTLSDKQIEYTSATVRMWAELWHGISWEVLSGKNAFDSAHLGRNVLVTNGYITVFNNELYDLPQDYRDENINLNTQVKEIDYKNCDNFGRKIKVKTHCSKTFTCDYLVVTIPQSLLKVTDSSDPGYLKWTPKLPPKISSVLPDIEFGSLGKVVFEFSECFWAKDIDRFYMLSNEVPSKEPRAWDYPAIFLNFQAIANVPTLLAIIQSPLSDYIENLDDKVKNDTIWALFEPLIKKLAVSDTIKPKNIYHTPWSNDNFVRGSYATTLVGKTDSNKIAEVFSEGLNERIRFAGAETLQEGANGCAHGGWLSGQREASFILNSIKTKSAKL